MLAGCYPRHTKTTDIIVHCIITAPGRSHRGQFHRPQWNFALKKLFFVFFFKINLIAKLIENFLCVGHVSEKMSCAVMSLLPKICFTKKCIANVILAREFNFHSRREKLGLFGTLQIKHPDSTLEYGRTPPSSGLEERANGREREEDRQATQDPAETTKTRHRGRPSMTQ